MKKTDIIHWIIIAVLFIYALQFAFQPTSTAIASQQDDAYYYLTIATNIADGNGATFDGIHKTNGFHPLWLLCLTAISAIPGLSLSGLVRLVIVMQSLMFLGSLILIKKNASPIFNPYIVGALLFIPIYPRFFNIFLSGMESGLLLVLLLLLFYLMNRFLYQIFHGSSFLYGAYLGGILALIVLTRLDTIVIAATILLFILYRDFRNHNRLTKASLAAVLAGGIIVVALLPFLIWNYANFGMITTISSMLKVKFTIDGAGDHAISLATSMPEYFIAFILAVIGIIVLMLNRKYLTDEQREDFFIPISLLSIGSFGLLLFDFLFVKWATFSYSFAFLLPVIIIGCATIFVILIDEFKEKPKLIITQVVLMLAFLFALTTQFYSLSRRDLGMTGRIYDTAVWARENTPDNAIFAMKDCGVFGYFSDRRTINLDGVVNNTEYQRYLRDDLLEEYLQENHVDYFVQHAFWFKDSAVNAGDYETYTLSVPSRYYNYRRSSITVAKENELYRSEYYQPRGQERTRVIIWELK